MAKKTVYRYVITSKSKEAYLASTKREAEAWTKKNGGTFRKAKASDRDKFPGYNIVVPRTAARAKAENKTSATARRSVKARAMEAKTGGGSQPRYTRGPNLQFEGFKAEQKGTDTAIKLTGGARAQSQGKKRKWPSKAKLFEAAQLPILNAPRRGGHKKLNEDQEYYFAAMESAAFLARMSFNAGTERQKQMVKDAGQKAIAALKAEYPWHEGLLRSGIRAAAKGGDWRSKFRTYR
jgi:hypothetical protein